MDALIANTVKILSPQAPLGKWLPRVVGFVLAMLLGFLFARAVWLVVGEPNISGFESPAVDKAVEESVSAEDDAQVIVRAHLFGKKNTATRPEKTAPKEKPKPMRRSVNLALHGVVAYSSGNGVAMIGKKGARQVDSYLVGEEVRPGVKLESVSARGAILDNAGEKIELVLEEVKGLDLSGGGGTEALSTKSNSGRTRPNIKSSRSRNTSRTVNDLPEGAPVEGTFSSADRDKIVENPLALAKDVSFTAVRRGGKVEGFRLMRVNNSMFSAWGLQRGDVVLEANGKSVQDFTDYNAALAELKSASTVHLKVKRRGKIVPVTINIR